MSEERGLICVYCGESWGYVGQEVREEDLRAAVEHEKTCPKNPHVQEIEMLHELIKRLRKIHPPKYQHLCHEWDGMDICEYDPEFAACTCFEVIGNIHDKEK